MTHSDESRRLHFVLTKRETDAIFALVSTVEALGLKKSNPLTSAANKMDEQFASQTAPWERCPNCKGTGWVEDE